MERQVAPHFTRIAVGKGQDTSPEVLAALGDDENPSVRRAVAENPRTPVETLSKLVSDSSIRVRLRLAFNPAAPSEILDALKSDNNEVVSWAAENRDIYL